MVSPLLLWDTEMPVSVRELLNQFIALILHRAAILPGLGELRKLAVELRDLFASAVLI